MNYFKNNTGLLLRFDDIAPNMNWKIMNQCEDLFLKYDIKPVLGVIPNNEDKDLLTFPENKDFWKKVNQWQSYGWEIAIHGYNHKYTNNTEKNDYFNYGGKSEFFGFSLDDQITKLKMGLKIFKENNINVRSFFAPNHTYDINTFKALKVNGIYKVIDGYGLFPYNEFGIHFTPQLLYKYVILPFGIQSTQIHLNAWDNNDFMSFKNFIEKNYKKIVNYNYVLSKTNNGTSSKISRFFSEYFLKFYRFIKSKS